MEEREKERAGEKVERERERENVLKAHNGYLRSPHFLSLNMPRGKKEEGERKRGRESYVHMNGGVVKLASEIVREKEKPSRRKKESSL